MIDRRLASLFPPERVCAIASTDELRGAELFVLDRKLGRLEARGLAFEGANPSPLEPVVLAEKGVCVDAKDRCTGRARRGGIS